MEQEYQVILNMLVAKGIDNKLFDYIDQSYETLAYIAWAIRASYRRTIMATPGQAIFGRDMIFNLLSVIDWLVLNAAKQQQVDIANVL